MLSDSHSPRSAQTVAVKKNLPLPSSGPIVIHDSLPFGSDNVETLEMQPEELDARADHLAEELEEKPDLGENPDPAAATHIV